MDKQIQELLQEIQKHLSKIASITTELDQILKEKDIDKKPVDKPSLDWW
jgi:hypothetical protein